MSTEREQAVLSSALWAAAGDALGWITELAGGKTVEWRAGVERVTEPVAWRRLIGGRAGVKIPLPAGTYSDDTQLRLAVCRAIRGNGAFDAEAFALVELTTWQSYALGAGRGTKAAAANLTKRGVNWFSNFFDAGEQQYIKAGGNGAAMRVQPHVWATSAGSDSFVLPVLRDALVTHGHPHGFCGAVFHAMAVADALNSQSVPGLPQWYGYLRLLDDLSTIISQDRQLAAFWKPAWEEAVGQPLGEAIAFTREEARFDLDSIGKLVESRNPLAYSDVLRTLGCLDERFRGSGLKTAIAASALAWLYHDRSIEEALVAAANVLQSDTDTIATMTGALLGATIARKPSWPIQDRDYIATEALRLAAIGRGEVRDGFAYPDLAHWQPPSTQSDSIGRSASGLAVAGLGEAVPQGEEYRAGNAVFQWLRLPFGQTVLGKRRLVLKDPVRPQSLPGERRQPPARERADLAQHSLPTLENSRSKVEQSDRLLPITNRAQEKIASHVDRDQPFRNNGIDGWTDRVIQSEFDDHTLGQLLNRCIDECGTIEGAMAFTAIIAKAKLTRRRRSGKR